jgi:CSLREA domain-containing protein
MSASHLRLVALSLACAALPALAADIVVTRTDDRFQPSCSSNCSLREAFYQANHAGGGQRIVLAAGTYRLTLADPAWPANSAKDPDEDDNRRGDLDVSGDVTLIGAGQGQTVIQGSGDRLIEVLYGGTLHAQKLTLRDGFSHIYGGALLNMGTTSLMQVSLLDNQVVPGVNSQGGAIANFGTLTVSHALFEGNHVDAGNGMGFVPQGGALFNAATVTVRDTTFRGNSVNDTDANAGRGGALCNQGNADIARTAFIGNAGGSSYNGGGGSAVANYDHGSLKLTNATVSGNLVSDSSTWPKYDYAVANGYDENGSDYGAVMQLINVTIAGNQQGVGLANFGQLSVRNSLIAGNGQGGVAANCENLGSSYTARGLLLGSQPVAGNCTADVPVDDALTFTKVIYPLADNNAETQTHALRKGSPAVDAGVGSCTTADQRSLSRPRDGDGDGVAVCDLGAYERAKP